MQANSLRPLHYCVTLFAYNAAGTDLPITRNLTHRTTYEWGIAIVTGMYAAHEPMPSEDELSRRHRLSRTVVREAIKMLSAKGLLDSRPRLGILVQPEHRWNLLDADVLEWHLQRPFSAALLRELTELRLSLEPGAATLAARRASPAATAAIIGAMQRLATADSNEDPTQAEIAFHVSVLWASGNRFFAQFAALTAVSLRFARRAPGFIRLGRQRPLGNYRKLVNAIGAGKASIAEATMRALIQEQVEAITSHP